MPVVCDESEYQERIGRGVPVSRSCGSRSGIPLMLLLRLRSAALDARSLRCSAYPAFVRAQNVTPSRYRRCQGIVWWWAALSNETPIAADTGRCVGGALATHARHACHAIVAQLSHRCGSPPSGLLIDSQDCEALKMDDLKAMEVASTATNGAVQ